MKIGSYHRYSIFHLSGSYQYSTCIRVLLKLRFYLKVFSFHVGIQVYGVQAYNNDNATPFYRELADRTNGAYVKFSHFALIRDMFLAGKPKQCQIQYVLNNYCWNIIPIFLYLGLKTL